MIPEPTTRLYMVECLESEMISSRNAMSSTSRHIYLDNTVYTKLRKLGASDDADSLYAHSLRHGKTIDIIPIA